jgi:hypothetical protein
MAITELRIGSDDEAVASVEIGGVDEGFVSPVGWVGIIEDVRAYFSKPLSRQIFLYSNADGRGDRASVV